jgi:hypothetical protein
MTLLSLLTSRPAVIEALEEFDSIGRDPFLEKYGFRKLARRARWFHASRMAAVR